MVTENFWRKRLNSDPNVLGRSITLNGVPNTIIGVLANLPISWFGRDTEIFANKLFEPADISKDRLMRGVSFMRVIARLKSGKTIQQAEATMPALQQGYREERPENADNSWASYLVPIAEDVTGNLRPAFHDTPGSGERGVTHRMQQCRELIVGAFHRTSARDCVAHGGGRPAKQHRSVVCTRKHPGQRYCGCRRIMPGALDGIGCSAYGRAKRSAGKWCIIASARACFHTGVIADHRSAHGPLSGMAKFAR